MSFLITAIALAFSWSAPATQPRAAASSRSPLSSVHRSLPPFFAMDTATKDTEHQTIESQVRLVKELGFDGWGPAYTPDLPATLKIMDREGVRLSALYVALMLDAAGPKYDPSLVQNMELLRGRGTIVWLVVRTARKAAHSNENDQAAIAVIREVAKLAEPAGVRVAIYPHTGDYISSTQDGLRMVKAVDRPNVGLSFNLCHWLRVDGEEDLKPLLKEMMPHLFVVSINGADKRSTSNDWSRLIQPLGEGDFDVYALMKQLQALGYRGPVGLQGYGLKGSVKEHLEQAIRVWKGYGDRMRVERP